MKKIIGLLKEELEVAMKEAEACLKRGNPCIELMPNNPYDKCEDLKKVISTLENYDHKVEVPDFGTNLGAHLLRDGQEIWVRAFVDGEVSFGKVDISIDDAFGNRDWVHAVDAVKDVVTGKPERVSGKVMVEYDMDMGKVINVSPIEDELKKERYKVVGYDRSGKEHTYSTYCTEEIADELIRNIGDEEVVALNGNLVTKLSKKLI